ncbi:hypothetical protein VSDG_06365 [Cytospora chrysosperma]|uniref:Protein kinase domain-containing protein n=1 Tax=Cytospora chrysosperma TaxID=252740 RepID=A0A423VPG8_CYTCH|nr:hypothetical protein VSDG_06365 [Valsa sordida]
MSTSDCTSLAGSATQGEVSGSSDPHEEHKGQQTEPNAAQVEPTSNPTTSNDLVISVTFDSSHENHFAVDDLQSDSENAAESVDITTPPTATENSPTVVYAAGNSTVDEDQSTGSSLKTTLNKALIQSQYDKTKYFLPRDAVERQVQPAGIKSYWLAHTDRQYHDKCSDVINYVCGLRTLGRLKQLQARLVFVILIFIDEPALILDVIKDDVNDDDLPLVIINKQGTDFQLARKTNKKCPIKCFDKWKTTQRLAFEHVQWQVTATVFSKVQKSSQSSGLQVIELDDQGVLPLTEYDTKSKYKGNSEVVRVKIHKAHHKFKRGENESFALKSLESEDLVGFELEAKALAKIRPKRHLVSVLAAFKYQNKYHLLFSQTSENMLMPPVKSDDKDCGRHGDIKPQNILWFKQDKNQYGGGVLKISDFGLTTFHSALTTKVGNVVPVTLSYAAPERVIDSDLSRPFDIWSLGCVYLEFITWLLLGPEQVEEFKKRRLSNRDDRTKFETDEFYSVYRETNRTYAKVKEPVTQWIKYLKELPECSKFHSEFLDYIQTKMLVVDKAERDKCRQVKRKLKDLYEKCKNDPQFATSSSSGSSVLPRGASRRLFMVIGEDMLDERNDRLVPLQLTYFRRMETGKDGSNRLGGRKKCRFEAGECSYLPFSNSDFFCDRIVPIMKIQGSISRVINRNTTATFSAVTTRPPSHDRPLLGAEQSTRTRHDPGLMRLWLKVSYLKRGMESWRQQLEKMITHCEELTRSDLHVSDRAFDDSGKSTPVNAVLSIDVSAKTNEADGQSDELRDLEYSETRIHRRLMELKCEYDEKIRNCSTIVEGMTLAAQLEWNQIGQVDAQTNLEISKYNLDIATATGNDSKQMRSIAVLTMIFLPATFVASLFSMSFFDLGPEQGSGNVSPWIWLYFVVTAGFTGVTVSAWILFKYQGLPSPTWPQEISLNALISVFTAFFKMSLIMPIAEGISQFKWLWFSEPRELADIERLDRASRGAWGSVLLLLSRVPRLNAIWLAILGALITIAELAIDPFSQQIIQTEPCLWNITGATAEVPKIQTYEARITTPSTKPRITGSMQAAIYFGLLSPPPNSSAAVMASCRTGNCTFPHDGGAAFSTLAMCQSCIDISDTITYGTSDTYDKRPATIPSGARIDGLYTMFASIGESKSFPPHTVFSFEALMSPQVTNDTNVDDFAVACGISPCLKTFSANVTDTIYQETELSSHDLVWSHYAGYTLATNMTLRNGTWQSLTHEMDPLNISAGQSLWYPDDCVWWFGTVPARAISSHLLDIFDNKTLETPYWSRSASSAQGDLWLVDLYRNGTANMDSINAYMNGLAWSMTGNMRQNSADSMPLRVVQGQMQRVESCLMVRWVWLSLPASLLGLEFAFLAAIVMFSRSVKHWRGDWKGSSLALLYHGLEDKHASKYDEKDAVGHQLRTREGMYKLAKGTRVQLRKGEGNWRFCEVA